MPFYKLGRGEIDSSRECVHSYIHPTVPECLFGHVECIFTDSVQSPVRFNRQKRVGRGKKKRWSGLGSCDRGCGSAADGGEKSQFHCSKLPSRKISSRFERQIKQQHFSYANGPVNDVGKANRGASSLFFVSDYRSTHADPSVANGDGFFLFQPIGGEQISNSSQPWEQPPDASHRLTYLMPPSFTFKPIRQHLPFCYLAPAVAVA